MSNVSFNIAATGIDAAQTAMDTIAQNLSNANTPGYVAQTANLVTNPGGDPLGVGDGVRVTSVTQANDALAVSHVQQAQGALSQNTALQQVLSQAQLTFQEPSSTGLASDLSNFWQSWDSIANNPSDPAARLQVVNQAQNLVSDLNQASQQLATTSANASTQLSGVVGEANSLLGQVATLNSQIFSAQNSGQNPNSLIDQRNQLMGQLSKDIGATGSVQSDGTYQVKVGGVPVVQGSWADTLDLAHSTSASGTPQTSLVAHTSGISLSTTSGTAAGLLAAVNQYLPDYQNQLDGVASALASTVNNQLKLGYTTTGAAGQPLFTGSTASGIGVNPAVVSDPTQIAASGVPDTPTDPNAAVNDGSNAQAVANLWNSAGGPDVAYRALVQKVGNQVSAVNNQVQSSTSVANAAQQNLQAVTGVDPNQQLVNLMNFQQSYQAAAKVISTVAGAVQSLLAAV